MSFRRVFSQLAGRTASHHQSSAHPNAFAEQSLSSWVAVTGAASLCGAHLGRGTSMPAALRACQQNRALASSSSSPQLSSRWAALRTQLCDHRLTQRLRSSAHSHSMSPATVRRWQPSQALRPHHPQSSTSSSSAARAFSSQAQRAQQRRRLQKQSSEQGVYLVSLVVGMVGLTYASVPLYRYSIQGLHLPHLIDIIASTTPWRSQSGASSLGCCLVGSAICSQNLDRGPQLGCAMQDVLPGDWLWWDSAGGPHSGR